MKTIKTLKVNGEEARIKVIINESNDPNLPGLMIDSNQFYSGSYGLCLRPAEVDGVYAGNIGGVRLRKNVVGFYHTYIQTDSSGHLCLQFNPRHFENNAENGLNAHVYRNNIDNVIPIVLGSANIGDGGSWDGLGIAFKNNGGIGCTERGEIYVDPEQIKGATQVTWDADSNMNNFKTPGVYEIYGERTRQDDNLPILNASSGHSIAARLIVVASTLQPANNEICITQFLMLSNRQGGDGNMYIRTYNENNSPFADWWTPWQKMQGVKEGYIFTDTVQVNPDGGVQEIVDVTGLNNMIDNGIYTGIYTDDPTFQTPTFIDTFTLIVINNYAVAGKDERLKRTISQLKYAVDAITNQATVKLRTKTDGDTAWSDWTDVSSGGGTQEVDVTDAVKAYGLPALASQGFVNDKTLYSACISDSINLPTLDVNDKIKTFLLSKHNGSALSFKFYLEKKTFSEHDYVYDIQCYATDSTSTWQYYHFVVRKDLSKVSVSESTTVL